MDKGWSRNGTLLKNLSNLGWLFRKLIFRGLAFCIFGIWLPGHSTHWIDKVSCFAQMKQLASASSELYCPFLHMKNAWDLK